MSGGGTDEALVRRAQRGDEAAFAELVRRHRDRVYAVTLRLCRNPADAEDALQETFLAAYRSLARFGRRARFSTWLYRIAVNASYDALGRSRRGGTVEDPQQHERPAPGDPFAQDAQRRALEAALRRLPREFLDAVVLCDIAGLGANEAAAVLDVAPGTVKSRVFRGRGLLTAMLREPSGAARVEQDER
jgi:RNA polymerase sigma-70 factor, ECF subfamily